MATSEPLPPAREFIALAAVTSGLNLYTFAPMLRWGLTDADAWADVAWARHPLADQLLVRLTGGVAGDDANFWRPAAMVQFWIERQLFGWNAVGWQAWDLAEHTLACVLAGLFVACTARFSGAPWRAVTWATTLLFAVHPLTEDVVPAVARNIDLLLAVGVFGALGSLVLFQAGRRWMGAPFLGFAAIALGAKESAVVLLPVAVGWIVLFRTDLDRWRRLREAIVIAAPLVVLIGAWLAVRAHVLRGVGGYAPLERDWILPALQRALVEPFFPSVGARLPAGWPTLLPIGVAAALMLRAGWRSRHRPMVLLGAGWFTTIILLHAVTGTCSRRVLYVPTLAGLLMIVPALVHSARRPLGLVVGGAWFMVFLHGSPAVLRYTQWEELSAASEVYRDLGFWEKVPANTHVWLAERPFRADLDRRTFRWRGVGSLHHGATSYALQAWLGEVLPDRRLRVNTLTGTVLRTVVRDQRVSVATEGTTLLVLHPGADRQDWKIRSPFVLESSGETLRVTPTTAGERDLVVVWTRDGLRAWRPGTDVIPP